ncbi:hypothetical protein B0T16DRAFT_396411 [Cercophora newfieldiana]|uniref:Uncharacterized protein n=1 Tax=Cercophora newfieldiana TaxID=92897 RepID=A0AA40CYI1_9PEZI|nr:hypothetical protein B0T16DRAFT_396411 [Cercophora newfieldiana]
MDFLAPRWLRQHQRRAFIQLGLWCLCFVMSARVAGRRLRCPWCSERPCGSIEDPRPRQSVRESPVRYGGLAPDAAVGGRT